MIVQARMDVRNRTHREALHRLPRVRTKLNAPNPMNGNGSRFFDSAVVGPSPFRTPIGGGLDRLGTHDCHTVDFDCYTMRASTAALRALIGAVKIHV